MDTNSKLKVLENELKPYVPALGKASETILTQNVSEYPIFIAHQQQMDIGIPIMEKDTIKGDWSINASTLEEFTTKGLIQVNKIDDFKSVYKNPEEFLCLFVISEIGATFVFLPRN